MWRYHKYVFAMAFSLVAQVALAEPNISVAYFEDKIGDKELNDIYSETFIKSTPSQLIFGVTKSTFWIKIEIEDFDNTNKILSIDRPLVDTLTFFYLNKDSTWVEQTLGITHSASKNAIWSPVPAIEISPQEHLNNIIYVKAKSTYALLLPVKIEDTQRFFLNRQQYDFFSALLLGALFVMMFYNLFLWISVREKAYLIYFFAIFSTLIIQSAVQGYALLIFPRNLIFPYYFVSIGIGINVILSVWFCMTLLDKINLSKWMLIGCYIIMGLGGAIILLELMSFYHLAKVFVVISTSLGSILLLSIGTILWFRKVSTAKFFTLAWAIYLVGIIVYGLRTEGILEHNFFTSNFAHIGKFVEVLLLSFAVGFKYNLVKNESETLQQKLNSELEDLVIKRTESLKKALEDKDVLIKEVHHRVKNNLQIVSSILSMQSRKLVDKQAREAVNEGKSRIKTMSLIHEKLYKSDELSRVNMKEYMKELNSYIFSSYKPENIEYEVKCENIILDIETSIPIGLIMNEAISNSLKYAFYDKKEEQIISELTNNQNEFILTIKDNGRGMPENFEVKNSTGTGMRLIRTLTDQLDGTLSITNKSGTEINITFQLPPSSLVN